MSGVPRVRALAAAVLLVAGCRLGVTGLGADVDASDDDGLAASGLVLLASPPRVAVFAIASDAANSVREAVWNGASWGAWTTLEGMPARRRFLSGCSSAGHTAVIWTQSSGASFDIAGKIAPF